MIFGLFRMLVLVKVVVSYFGVKVLRVLGIILFIVMVYINFKSFDKCVIV